MRASDRVATLLRQLVSLPVVFFANGVAWTATQT
ncbi:hypothetical protein NKDENANG_04022 [Candidatus Entotheonellaceae bacterium PAL068K]